MHKQHEVPHSSKTTIIAFLLCIPDKVSLLVKTIPVLIEKHTYIKKKWDPELSSVKYDILIVATLKTAMFWYVAPEISSVKHSSDYEDCYVLACDTVWSDRILSTFQRNVLPPSIPKWQKYDRSAAYKVCKSEVICWKCEVLKQYIYHTLN